MREPSKEEGGLRERWSREKLDRKTRQGLVSHSLL